MSAPIANGAQANPLNSSSILGGVLVAIDIAKRRNEVLIDFPGAAKRERLTVLNTRQEYDRFLAYLTGLDRPVIAAFEATGNYHRPIGWRLVGGRR